MPTSSTHGWKCQGSALAPTQTAGVCKDMQVLHLERSSSLAAAHQQSGGLLATKPMD